ncbi:MAG: hypothetical protein WBP94_12885 [Rhodomicrobiaceae bacterium]
MAAAVLASVLVCPAGFAQGPSTGILAPGNAAVTGFSGAPLPIQIARGVDPADKTFIDLNGATLRIIDLQDMHGLPNAQLVGAPKPYVATAAQIGQVFGVAIDNAAPPNIYVAASSAYGLPIVRAGRDGLLHVRRGFAQTSFMPGLWGSAPAGGGPGSIWKIDGVTGAVTLFANVTLDGALNSGPALGGLAFDPVSNSLLVADRETGMIHSFGMNGEERARYDHGVQGRAAQGLPPVLFDPKKRLDITSPQFDSEQPATWNYAPPERRVFGLGIYAGRLYYAVAADLQIWSVSLTPDGSFGNDPTLELSVPPTAGPTEISKILFDDQGRMFLAERPIPSGAFDFLALTQEGIGRVLRYVLVDSQPGAARIWQAVPDEYAIGFPLELRNGNGGVAVGYGYDAAGVLDRGTCGGFLWSTGEQLRKTSDAELATHLGESGPANVDGLQGNRIGLIRPMNVPPLRTYFIDYDDRFDEDGGAARGHLGDITIWRVCGPALREGWMLPGWMVWSWLRPSDYTPPPSQSCPPDQKKPGYRCCPAGTAPDAAGQCQPWCPNGATDPGSRQFCGLGFDQTTYDPNDLSKLRCIGGTQPDAAKGIFGCVDKSPVLNAPVCQAGWSKQTIPNLGKVCAPTPQQLQCGAGQQVSSIDGHCHNLCLGIAWPSSQCCAAGSVLSVSGRCCPPGSDPDPNTGTCRRPPERCPATQISTDGICCPKGSTPNTIIGGCCPSGQSATPGSGQCKLPSCPPPGKMIGSKCCAPEDLQPGGACATCPQGEIPVGPSNACCDRRLIYTDRSGAQVCCRSGTLANGVCQPTTNHGVPVLPQCTPGSTDPKCCASGYQPVANGCCLASQITSQGMCCPPGQTPGGPNKAECQPTRVGWYPPTRDGGGDRHKRDGGQCCMTGLIPAGDGSCCAPDQITATGLCCPAGQKPGPDRRSCVPTTACTLPATLVSGACCPRSRIYKDASGGLQCCPQDVNQDSGRCEATQPRRPCAAGYTEMPDGSCCINRLVSEDGTSCRVRPGGAPTLVPVPIPEEPACPPGWYQDPDSGACVVNRGCPQGTRYVDGACVRTPTTTTPPRRLHCRAGQVPNADGTACISIRRHLVCRPGQVPNATGTGCISGRRRLVCRPGQVPNATGTGCISVRRRLECRPGQVPNSAGTACIPLRRRPFGGQFETGKPSGRTVAPWNRPPSSKRLLVPRLKQPDDIPSPR